MKQYRVTYKDGSVSELDYMPSSSTIDRIEERDVTEWQPVTLYSVYYTVGQGADVRSDAFQFWASTVEEALTKVLNLIQTKTIKSCTMYKHTVKILDYDNYGVGE